MEKREFFNLIYIVRKKNKKNMSENNMVECISNELIDLLIYCDDFDFSTSGSCDSRDGGYREVGYIRGGGITIHRDDNVGFSLSVDDKCRMNPINILELNKKLVGLSDDDILIIWDNIIDEYIIMNDNKKK